MAKYLLTIKRSGGGEPSGATLADTLIDWVDEPSRAESEGLERWTLALTLAGMISDWAKAGGLEALLDFVAVAVDGLEVRPRGEIHVQSRADPHTLKISLPYMGASELARAKGEAAKRLKAVLDEHGGKKLKADVAFSC